MMDIDNIYKGDCLELLKTLEDKSVDVTITSPPYGDNGKVDAPAHNPYGTHKKYLNVESHVGDWFEWQCEVIDELLRVSKKLVVYNIAGIKANRENVYKLIGHYAKNIHDILIWYKPNGLVTCTPNSISNTYEYVILLKPEGVSGVKVNSELYRNVIVHSSNIGNPFADIHHAVMPMSFCAELVREFTSEGDVVLDPFSGMATTAVCALRQGRHFIGFELCDEYYTKSLDRVSKERTKINSRLF